MAVHAEHEFMMCEIKITQIKQEFWIFYTNGCAGEKCISCKQNANNDADVHTLAIGSCTEKTKKKNSNDATGKNCIDGENDTEHTLIASEQIQSTDSDG